MNPIDTFIVGIAPDHAPALIAALLLPVLVLVVRRLRPDLLHAASTAPSPTQGTAPSPAQSTAGASATGDPTDDTEVVLGAGRRPPRPGRALQPRTVVRTWNAWLLGLAGVVHLALPLGHADNWALTVLFLGDGVAFVWLAVRAWEGRTYRLWSGLLIGATVLAYLVVAGTGKEEPDQVGIVTAFIELLALGLCLVPSGVSDRPRRLRRFGAATATVVVVLVAGAWIWIGSFAAHVATGADARTVTGDPTLAAAGIDHSGHDDGHAHDHAARAQAGVIMRPQTDAHPTVAQIQAADDLARRTREAMAKYQSLDAALADGFVLPAVATGPDVHLDNKANASDGRVLDPARPEKLVYAISGGRATLLGVVYVMEKAGVPGPEPGGSITRWHAHNVCLTALPPGFSVVDSFGTCPPFSVAVTSSEMMHVWVVDNPGGWFAEGLDKEWVRVYHAEHGLPYPTR